MNKLSRIFALSVFGLSGSVFAAEDNADRNRALSNLDADGDGSVNFEEFQQRGTERLSRLDSDADGLISLDEYLNARPDGPTKPNRAEREPSAEQLARMEQIRAQMQERAAARFTAMDTDGDEAVSQIEYFEAEFLALDADNNGLLSAEELRPKRRGPRGRGGRSDRGERGPEA